jgi:hypothetical protein
LVKFVILCYQPLVLYSGLLPLSESEEHSCWPMHVGRKEAWDQSLERRVINGENKSKPLGNWKRARAVQNQFSISCDECIIPENYQVDVLVIYCPSVKTAGCLLLQMVILRKFVSREIACCLVTC